MNEECSLSSQSIIIPQTNSAYVKHKRSYPGTDGAALRALNKSVLFLKYSWIPQWEICLSILSTYCTLPSALNTYHSPTSGGYERHNDEYEPAKDSQLIPNTGARFDGSSPILLFGKWLRCYLKLLGYTILGLTRQASVPDGWWKRVCQIFKLG